MTTADRAGLVVMCCATADAMPLRETVESLREEGNDVRVVTGLEADPSRLTDAIGDLKGQGLYVLCRSPRLGREHVEKLREILLAHHIPFARTLTVAVGGRGALAERVRSGLRRASARGESASRDHAPAPAPAPTPAPSSPPAAAATEDEEPTIVGKPFVMGDPAPVMRDDPEGEAPTLPPPGSRPVSAPMMKPPEPSAETASEEQTDEEADEARGIELEDTLSSSPLSLSDLDLSDLDDSIPGARIPPPPKSRANPERSTALITGNTMVGPAPAMITGDTLTGEELPERLRRAAARQTIAHWPPPSSPSPSPASEPFEPATTPFTPLSTDDLEPELPPRRPPSSPAPASSAPAPGQPDLHAAPPSSPMGLGGPATSGSVPVAMGPGGPPPSGPVPAAMGPGGPPPSGPVPATMGPSGPVPAAMGPGGPPPSGPAPAAMGPGGPAPSGSVPAAMGPGGPTPAMMGPSGPTPAMMGPSASTSIAADADEAPRRLSWVLIGGVAVTLVGLVITIAAWPSDETKEASSTAAADTPKDESSDDPSTPDDGVITEDESTAAGGTPVLDALRSRKVRALDVLLVTAEPSKPSDHDKAAKYCADLEIESLGGWRLPRLGELSAMSDARLVPTGHPRNSPLSHYWSESPADLFGDSYMAWNERRETAAPYDGEAVALCVRPVAGGDS